MIRSLKSGSYRADPTAPEPTYWVKKPGKEWEQVSKEDYMDAERSAGFHSKGKPGSVATASFFGRGIEGKITYGEPTEENQQKAPDPILQSFANHLARANAFKPGSDERIDLFTQDM